MNLDLIESELIDAKDYFTGISPGPTALLTGRIGRVVGWAHRGWGLYKTFTGAPSEEKVATVIGAELSNRVTTAVLRGHPDDWVASAHRIAAQRDNDLRRKNGLGGRSWLLHASRHPMVIVFHDANRAGPHIDIHIDKISLVYRVKPELAARLRYGPSGYLTEASKAALLDHVRSEVASGARVPQNLDHSVANARQEWVHGGTDGTDYGAGPTRQIIADTQVDIYKHQDTVLEFYAPLLSAHRTCYLYRLYSGTDRRAPILIFGTKKAQPPHLEDRLHLKLIQPGEFATRAALIRRASAPLDLATTTGKLDGSSCYFVISPKNTTVWSPRESKVHGQQIEYSTKLNELYQLTNGETIVGMGELMFAPIHRNGRTKRDEFVPCAVGGGILNAHELVPERLAPTIWIYRIDRIGRRRTTQLDFWENRRLQEQVAALDPTHFRVVELMTPDQARKRGFEGFVVAPENKSVNDAIKVKFWQDAHDWEITAVEFTPGPAGGLAGVVKCRSLESAKTFSLGPGQIGDRRLCEAMMAHPSDWVGTVLKVQSRQGHEGRAAKVLMVHDDKGTAAF